MSQKTIILPKDFNLSTLPLSEKNLIIQHAKEGLGIHIKSNSIYDNPFLRIPTSMLGKQEEYLTWLFTRPEYFWTTTKHILGVDLFPFQDVIIQELWNRKFPMLIGNRGMGKTFVLAVYALLRMILLPDRKIVICGSAFRQSQLVFNYMEKIIKSSPILSAMIPEDNISHGTTAWRMTFNNSECLAIPVGHSGESVRGLRANDVIADEFAAQNVDVFETVIAGFASVNSNPTGKAAKAAADRIRKILGFEIMEDPDGSRGNQIIISGTAYYAFNHFSKYHDKYRAIIKTRGDAEKLEDMGVDDPSLIDYRDYSVIRMPHNLLPPNFMDESQIIRAKTTVHSSTFLNEYLACFARDSDGFFKRTLIEECTVKNGVPMINSQGEELSYDEISFSARLSGDPDKSYIMAIDPAMSADRFSILILEVHEKFRGVVYCWTTNNKEHKEKLKMGTVKDNNYYAYCAKKVRSLLGRFNVSEIAIDWGGGGGALLESLNDKNILDDNDVRYWPKITDKPKDTDAMTGRHIIEVVQFSRTTWIAEANHGMRTDMEHKKLLFPEFDGFSMLELDTLNQLVDIEDNFDVVMAEIEELKEELTTIMITHSQTGIERFDTPSTKRSTDKKGKLLKDRYSALLMANKSARDAENAIKYEHTFSIGGFSHLQEKKNDQVQYEIPAYTGNPNVARALAELYI